MLEVSAQRNLVYLSYCPPTAPPTAHKLLNSNSVVDNPSHVWKESKYAIRLLDIKTYLGL